MTRLATAAFTICLSAQVAAQDCDLQIRDGTAARDLGRALKCLDDRIRALEARSSQAATARENAVEFDAGSFVLAVRSASRERDRVNVIVRLRNKTTDEIYVASEAYKSPILVDEVSGKALSAVQVVGLQQTSDASNLDERAFTSIAPNATQTVAVAFTNFPARGSKAAMTLNLLQYARGQTKRITTPFDLVIRD